MTLYEDMKPVITM